MEGFINRGAGVVKAYNTIQLPKEYTSLQLDISWNGKLLIHNPTDSNVSLDITIDSPVPDGFSCHVIVLGGGTNAVLVSGDFFRPLENVAEITDVFNYALIYGDGEGFGRVRIIRGE